MAGERLALDSDFARRGRSVLVWQEQLEEAEATAEQIRRLGHEAVSVVSEEEALRAIEGGGFSVVVMDWPFGKSVFSYLARDARFETLPRIALVDDSNLDPVVQDGYRLGADVVLLKPVPDEAWVNFLAVL